LLKRQKDGVFPGLLNGLWNNAATETLSAGRISFSMSTFKNSVPEEQQDVPTLRLCLERSYKLQNQQPAADLMRLALRLSRIGGAPAPGAPRLRSPIDRPMATMPARQSQHVTMAGW